jgi:hypothetical protein
MKTNSSAFHIAAISMLAQSDKVSSLSIATGTLEDIQEAVKLFGGNVYVTPSESEYHSIYYRCSVGNSSLWIHIHHTTKLACVLQREYFQSNESIFEKGTDLTIVDNQYFVISNIIK